MQQVIGGQLRGRRLLALPRGTQDVRPTSSRVRGAIFDRMQGEVQGAQVLDLFAGSGANAVEALSRGAAHATLVEKQPKIHQFLQRQVQALGLEDRVTLIRDDARNFLSRRSCSFARYDLVLCDPPYAQHELYGPVLTALQERELLASGALVVVERPARGGALISAPAGWQLERERRYGDTQLQFWRQGSDPSAGAGQGP